MEKLVVVQDAWGGNEWLRKNEPVIARRLSELMVEHGVKNLGQLSRILRVEEKLVRAIFQRLERQRMAKK